MLVVISVVLCWFLSFDRMAVATHTNVKVMTEIQETQRTNATLDGEKEKHAHEAQHKQYPYVVMLYLWYRGNWIHNCGGTILSHEFILTACHCIGHIHGTNIDRYKPSFIRIIAGTDIPDDPSNKTRQRRRGKQLIPHPRCAYYEATMFEYDVGIIRMVTPLRFNNHVNSVRVPTLDIDEAHRKMTAMKNEENVTCVVPGWRKSYDRFSKETSSTSPTMEKFEFILISEQECAETFCNLKGVFCTQDFDRRMQTCGLAPPELEPCSGDGGPLICHSAVWGLASWSLKCQTDFPQVFSSVEPVIYMFTRYVNPKSPQKQRNNVNSKQSRSTSSSLSLHVALFHTMVSLVLHSQKFHNFVFMIKFD